MVVAAYALMVEAMTGLVVEAGYLVSLRDGVVERVCVDDALRAEAVREAERVAAALASDPGLPGDPGECPASCPFRGECWGGVGLVGGRERGEARVDAEA